MVIDNDFYMKLALDEPRSLLSQGNYSHHTILDVLEEMERLIVDYLAGVHKGSIIIAFYIKIQYWYGGGRRSLLSNRQRKVRTPRK